MKETDFTPGFLCGGPGQPEPVFIQGLCHLQMWYLIAYVSGETNWPNVGIDFGPDCIVSDSYEPNIVVEFESSNVKKTPILSEIQKIFYLIENSSYLMVFNL